MSAPKFDVVRLSDGEVLRGACHPVVAASLAYYWNRALYHCGPYCEVRPAALAKAVQP